MTEQEWLKEDEARQRRWREEDNREAFWRELGLGIVLGVVVCGGTLLAMVLTMEGK